MGGARGARPGRPIVKGVRGQESVRKTNAPNGSSQYNPCANMTTAMYRRNYSCIYDPYMAALLISF